MIKRLRIKFVCINMILVTVMLLAILGLQYQSTRTSLERASLTALEKGTMGALPPGRPGATDRTGTPCFRLWLVRGQMMAEGDGYYDLTDGEYLLEILESAMAENRDFGVLKEYSLRFLRHQGPFGQEEYVFTDISAEIQTLNRLLRNCILIGGAAFLAFLGISILLARWAVKPVQKAWDQQRQFVADASHELKTPLTVILTNAELLQSPDYEEQDRVKFAESILTMSRQMRGLVESLLDLARVDNGQIKTGMENLDYSKLVSDAVLPFEPLYFEEGLELDSETEPGIQVRGSSRHLKQVVEILLDNGRKYSTANTTVRLRLSRQGHSQCLLAVAGQGEPLSAEDCENIFKRFYRADPARSMNHSYGLGLAIARQIVEEHGGKIWAASRDGWNTFFVSLPAKNPRDFGNL